MHVRSTTRRLGAFAVALGLAVGVTACDDPPTTVRAVVDFDCEIKSNHFLVPNTTGTNTVRYDSTGPQAVAPAGAFVVKVAPEPFSVNGDPTSYGTVTQVSNLVWKLAVPANASLTSHTITGWSNVGAGTPTSSVSGGVITVTIPGPIASGTTASPNVAILPTVTMNLTATGPAGSRISPKIAGTTYASPGLTFATRVTGTLVGTLNPTFSCFPTSTGALRSTLISTDVRAPSISITAPVAGQTITRNAVVKAGFTCNDGTGVGVASCVGTVANGASIDTATVGTKTFTVTATDLEGKVGTKSVTYTVVT
jgi:dehydratase